MNACPAAVQRYLDKNASKGSWSLTGDERNDFAGAIVIPSLAEGASLFATLLSLAENPLSSIKSFLVVVVVNHGEQASVEDKQQNHLDLAHLSALVEKSELCLAWVDAASSGHEVPAKQAGVGFARKLGMDLALSRLNWSADPLLVCLDADSLVEENYLQTIVTHFCQSSLGAAVLPYCHQPGGTAEQQAAIDRYELFLRSYVYGLHLAGSPYAFNTVGSAMACRASAYVRCGGMNCRKAAEDFYFLQKLAKTDGVDLLTGTTVFPEPRVSTRVPFGTGRSMGRLLDGDTQAVLFYPVAVFQVLSDWLGVVVSDLSADVEKTMLCAQEISSVLAGYLEQERWQTVWPRLQATHQTSARRLQAFHTWFDGFRSMRLIHLLCENGFVRGEPQQLLPDYFAWEGRACSKTLAGILEDLRSRDGGGQLADL